MTKSVKIIIAVVLGAGVLGTGGYFGYKYLYKTPKKVITAMQEKLSSKEIKTFHYKMETAFSGESEDQPVKVNLDMEGDANNSDLKNSQTKNDISGSIEYQGISFSVQLELRTIGEDLYLKLTKIPTIPLGDLPIDLSSFEDQWIKTSSSDLSDLYGSDIKKGELTAAQEEEIRKLIKNTEFFNFEETEALKPEEVNGVSCYHYKTKLDKKALVDFIEKYNKIVDNEIDSSTKKDLEESLDDISDLYLELWIGKKDNLLYKASSKFNIKTDTENKIDISFILNLSKYNEPVTVEKPKEAKSLKDIMNEYLENLYGGHSTPESYEIPESYEMPEEYEVPENSEMPTFP